MCGRDARDKKRPGCTLSRVCTLGPQDFQDSSTFSLSGSKTTSTTRPVSAILSLALPRYRLARRFQRHILGGAGTPAKSICRASLATTRTEACHFPQDDMAEITAAGTCGNGTELVPVCDGDQEAAPAARVLVAKEGCTREHLEKRKEDGVTVYYPRA